MSPIEDELNDTSSNT